MLFGNTFIGRKVIENIAGAGIDDADAWKKHTSADEIDQILRDDKDQIVEEAWKIAEATTIDDPARRKAAAYGALERESRMAGAIADLSGASTPAEIMDYFHPGSVATTFTQPVYKIAAIGAADMMLAVARDGDWCLRLNGPPSSRQGGGESL